LIKQYYAKNFRIKVAAHCRTTPTARAAMKNDNGYTVSTSTLFNVNFVAITNVEHALIKRLNR
jgi:hypothetical protein